MSEEYRYRVTWTPLGPSLGKALEELEQVLNANRKLGCELVSAVSGDHGAIVVLIHRVPQDADDDPR